MEATRVRDPVHNFITLREAEVKLLKTRALQRLRGIKQLALASLVYPGALHTRFDHTLGVTHVAGSMAESLGLCRKRWVWCGLPPCYMTLGMAHLVMSRKMRWIVSAIAPSS